MKYNVGDKVRIKPKYHFCSVDSFHNINMKDEFFNEYSRLPYCETVMTIGIVNKDFYILKEDRWAYKWTDEMIECKVEEETKPELKFKVGDKIKLKSTLLNDIFGVIGYEPEGYRITSISNGLMYFMSYSIEHYYELVEEEVGLVDNLSSRWVNEFNLPDGYIFKDENGNVINTKRIVLEKKKKEYPKTYEECAKLLNTYCGSIGGYNWKLLSHFQQLLICRDAYWKIAGDELGLGKPWEPDWNNISDKYCIYFVSGEAWSKECQTRQCPFAFPTEEMRDAFKKNFDPDIEFCKELL